MTEPTLPRVRFLIGGVQKGGTTALAHCLAQHPGVLLPARKEAHVFDAPDFDEGWSGAEIDRRYAAHFADAGAGRLCGDATPIYCLHERFIERIARYNPRMRWLLLLRDPVERAISQYHMERARGDERWPLLPALLLERWRLRGHRDDFAAGSPLRHHAYRLRGDYARQLDALYRHFPRGQVLVLRSDAFRRQPGETMARVYAHLDLAGPVRLPDRTEMFAGDYAPPSRGSPTMAVARWLLRGERRRLRRQHGIAFD
ncbi:MAG: sulfotransferase [Pseudomonadota bacterium]|nr:sulfotransferase [Pseudomonadota bacterium]